ncbi:trans-4-hydroxy-L-proline dehydratase [Labilibaculum antarcticum]|uniref:Pyruvate formate-lyase n=1 Tax=Labilibaculum antarcticum TaxID=1717717 RepID=A0A1Y1CFJ1_9BACT|nr:trans-4-hydroxy-L-proline dehydratase [Labilibaculum antarcticum]BAX79138.1 pyruvate formate-lyase [Labilibaculum antarcticum]
MNNRIKQLRDQSINAINSISPERALLMTEFYQSDEAQMVSTPVKRALSFKYIFANKKICINDNELIVGERGPAPKSCPTFPEICIHSLDDLTILSDREKVSFQVDEETRKVYEETIIPYWKGKTNRDKLIGNMTPEWLDAYGAGIFTEFQEQRAPGHTVLGKKMFQKGFLEVKDEIQKAIDQLDFFSDANAYEKQEELKAMAITCDGIILFANRHAEELERLAKIEKDATRKAELEQMAAVCRRVPAHAPETFHEALQHYWFIHLGVITELNPWDSFNPGRLDQHLQPFYVKEVVTEKLSKEDMYELLQAFWVKFNNHPAPPKMGVTAKESNTYTDFCLINIGGLKEDGSDAVNDMSYVLLDVIEEMRLLQPSSMVQVSKKSPDRFLKRTLKILKTGFGQPSIFNTDAVVQEMLRQGKSIEDARNGGCSGCVETGAFGTENYSLSGYFNLAKILEITLNNGYDSRTKKQIGLQTGAITDFSSYEDVFTAWQKQVNYFADIKIRGNNVIERLYANYLPVPFLSVLVADCISNGQDYNAGGARYNTSYVQGVGLGSLADMFSAIKYQVFDQKRISLEQLKCAMDQDFVNHDQLRSDLVYDTPKYGNDEAYADDEAIAIFETFYSAINGRPSSKGGVFRINMLPTTCHVYFGNVMGASADGRLAGKPLSEGISPFQGADTKGPTAVVKSASKIDHLRTGGTLLNQKFSPSFMDNEAGITQVMNLVRSYFRMDGHHIQFNVVSVDTLKAAQKSPENYKDLIVRVAGYSDYFNDLGEDLQNEIIQRNEHKDF